MVNLTSPRVADATTILPVPVSTGPLLAVSLSRSALLLAGVLVAGVLLTLPGVSSVATWRPWVGNLVVVAVDVVILVLVARLLARSGGSLRGLVGRCRPRDLAVGLGVGVILLVALLAATFAANLIVYQGPPPMTTATEAFRVPLWFGLWCLIVMPVTVALAEEVFYRGYLQPRWIERLGARWGIVVVSAFFGLQHVAFSLATPQAALARVLGTFLVGLVLSLLYRRIGRLWPLIIGHWLVDALGLGLPVFLVSLGG